MLDEKLDVRRRLASWGWDYLVVLAWLIFVFIVIGIPQLRGWLDLTSIWSQPVTADIAVTVLTVVPYLAYLVVTEAGSARATWGKRRSGLIIHGTIGGVRSWRVVVRNALKALPWQLGHMSAMRFAAAEDDVPWVALLYFTTSMVVLAWIVIPILLGRRGIHDRVAGTEVHPRVSASRT